MNIELAGGDNQGDYRNKWTEEFNRATAEEAAWDNLSKRREDRLAERHRETLSQKILGSKAARKGLAIALAAVVAVGAIGGMYISNNEYAQAQQTRIEKIEHKIESGEYPTLHDATVTIGEDGATLRSEPKVDNLGAKGPGNIVGSVNADTQFTTDVVVYADEVNGQWYGVHGEKAAEISENGLSDVPENTNWVWMSGKVAEIERNDQTVSPEA